MLRIFLVALLGVSGLRAETLSVASASDLVYCLEELNAAFWKTHPQADLKATTGASGNIFAQIQNGAPIDVFLSADVKYPRELIKAGLAEEESLAIYAIGHLVVWTNKDGVDVSSGLAVKRYQSVHMCRISVDMSKQGREKLEACRSRQESKNAQMHGPFLLSTFYWSGLETSS
jgi:molybdate transport system substrate-binding protein